MPAVMSSSIIYENMCLDETYASVNVTHKKLPVKNNLEVRHRIVPGGV
jgi:hypothetical protein